MLPWPKTVWKKGDAEAAPGGYIKPKCPVAAHVAVRVAGNAGLQACMQPCYATLGQYRLLETTASPPCCTPAALLLEVISAARTVAPRIRALLSPLSPLVNSSLCTPCQKAIHQKRYTCLLL
ncbi:hypothetical protein KIL84_000905 [Mauremys mutica]|uniref:Uncharacterized protein n=1 Tax=Mauremys mutica TaxID=74926 RepID=A0A9D4AVD6_9SAUR|nr:hypothetical protein KIL84_000905 [Mauremys mutica]